MKKIEGDVNLYAMEIPVILPRHSYIDSHKRVDYLTSLPILSQPKRKPKAIQPPVYARSKTKKQVPNKTQEWRNQVSPHVPLSGDFDPRINSTAINDRGTIEQLALLNNLHGGLIHNLISSTLLGICHWYTSPLYQYAKKEW